MTNTEERRFHSQVERGLRKITYCIIDLIVKSEGRIRLDAIENYTGLVSISLNITADILLWMKEEDIIEINGAIITGDMQKLTQILEQAKANLPNNHGKPWSEHDYVRLAEMKLAGTLDPIIAKKLDRTEKSIAMQATILHKAFRLIPIIQKYKSVREFVRRPVSPNPER